MCRMMVCIDKKEEKGHSFSLMKKVLVSWARNENQNDGVGISYIENGGLVVEKSGFPATKVDFTGDAIKSKVIIGHVRQASNGYKVNETNAHPFLNESGDLVFCHNGTIHNYKHVKAYLKKQGHDFESYTDSEILLHAIEEWGVNRVMKELRKRGVYGKVNWLLMDLEGRVTAYSGGHMYISVNDKSIIIATNKNPFKRNSWKYIAAGTLVKIGKNHQIHKKHIGYFPLYYNWNKDKNYITTSIVDWGGDGTSSSIKSLDDYTNFEVVEPDVERKEWEEFKDWLEKQKSRGRYVG